MKISYGSLRKELKRPALAGLLAIIIAPLTALAGGIDTATAVRAAAPGTAFMVGEPLKFHVEIPRNACYSVEDIWGRRIVSGKVSPGELLLPPLDAGYYRLRLEADGLAFDGERSFAILRQRRALPPGKGSPFAVYSGLSGQIKDIPAKFRGDLTNVDYFKELYRRGSIYAVRETMDWWEPTKGTYVWRTQRAAANALHGIGIEITGYGAVAPAWSIRRKCLLPEGVSSPYRKDSWASAATPDDLRDYYKYAKDVASEFKGEMESFEIGNEPDLNINAPWEYAAAEKVAYLGLKEGNPRIKTLLGSAGASTFLHSLPELAYMRVVLKNGCGAYFDIYNHHSYDALNYYPELVSKMRKTLSDFGLGDRPLCITELGSYADGIAEATWMGEKVQSREQEMLMAEFTAKSQILMQSLGCSRQFLFYMPPGLELGWKNWGELRYDYSVKPSFTAFAVLSRTLAGAKYLGQVKTDPGVRGFLYEQPDGTQSLALWVESALDTESYKLRTPVKCQDFLRREIELALPDGSYELLDSFGFQTRLSSVDGKLHLPISRFTSYLNGLHGLKASTPPVESGSGCAGGAGLEKGIVIRPLLSSLDFSLPKAKDMAILEKKRGVIVLEIYNFCDLKKTGTIKVEGGSTERLPSAISIPPKGKVEFKIDFTPDYKPGALFCDFEVTGEFDGKAISPAFIPMTNPKRLVGKDMAAMDDASKWRPLSSGELAISNDPVEDAMKLHALFKDEGKGGWGNWFVAEYILPAQKEFFAGAVGMEFECKVDKASAEKGISHFGMRHSAGTLPNQESYFKSYEIPPPPGTEWERRKVLFFKPVIPLEEVRMIGVGFHAQSKDVTFYMRNFKMLYSPDK